MEGYVSSLVRSADAALLLVDLGDDDGPFGAEAAVDRLAQTKTVLTGQIPSEQEDPTVEHIKTLLVANKIDLPGAEERLAMVRELFGQRFGIQAVSAEHGTDLEDLRLAVYRFLNVIRVYTKQPGKPPDLTSPFTCPVGSTLVEMAALVHRDFQEKLKSARIWGTDVYDGQTVKRDHVLHDKDIVELHV
jgi:ribosome-interacting GTPase 1